MALYWPVIACLIAIRSAAYLLRGDVDHALSDADHCVYVYVYVTARAQTTTLVTACAVLYK